jgi:geranylgeranyl reductase family protein
MADAAAATETPDVLIAGLGPAGSCAAAALLAQNPNLTVVALERKQVPGAPVQCAEFVPAMLEHEVERLSGVAAQGIDHMCTQVEGQAADVMPNFMGRIIDREAFDRMLAQRAAGLGADCRYGVHISSVEPNGEVVCGDGARFRPRVLIGADGPRSRAGRAIGSINEDLVETRQITVPLLRPHEATDIFLRADIVGGYGWLFPKGGKANLGLGVVPEKKKYLKPLLDDLHKRLMAEGRVGPEVLGHTGGAIPVGGRLPSVGTLAEVPVLLAGDAAGLTNPVTGAGIAAAVQSGGLAGRAAAAWLAGDKEALEDYEDDLGDLFDSSLDRAVARRRELLALYAEGNQPGPAALRRGWIAYDQYWAA